MRLASNGDARFQNNVTLPNGTLTITVPTSSAQQAISLTGYNTVGGATYFDFLKATNN